MNHALLAIALDEIGDRAIAEAAWPVSKSQSLPPVRKVKKRILTLAFAAVLLLAMSVTAYAYYTSVATPEAAERVALEQIEVWKEMGILSREVVFHSPADRIREQEEHIGSSYWFGRLFPHSYDVNWYFNASEGKKYGCHLNIDTASGKIMGATLFALADETDVPIGEITLEMGDGETRTAYTYDNFDDLFSADMTVERLCSLLCEYWGFSGYQIDSKRVTGGWLLKDLPKMNYHLNVYFEGDQPGVPMYISLEILPEHTALIVGTGHPVG